ncbi:unnamed protein product [Sphacelaria rigidula]
MSETNKRFRHGVRTGNQRVGRGICRGVKTGGYGLQRIAERVTRDEVKEGVTEFKNRKAAGGHEIVQEFLECGREGMVTMMVMLFNWIWENEYTRKG